MEAEIKITNLRRMFNIPLLDQQVRAGSALVTGVSAFGEGGSERAFMADTVIILLADEVDEATAHALKRIVHEHDSAQLSQEQSAHDKKLAARQNVRARFVASAIAGRTPEQIYTTMQAQIDGWASLADAKRDLKAWLPLLAAVLAWEVMEG